MSLMSPSLAGGFFTTSTRGKPTVAIKIGKYPEISDSLIFFVQLNSLAC